MELYYRLVDQQWYITNLTDMYFMWHQCYVMMVDVDYKQFN